MKENSANQKRTVKIEYGGATFLMDTRLLKKGCLGIFRNTPCRAISDNMEDITMTMVVPPMPKEEVLKRVMRLVF